MPVSDYIDPRNGIKRWQFIKRIEDLTGKSHLLRGKGFDTKAEAMQAEQHAIDRLLHPELVLARAAKAETLAAKERTTGTIAELIDLMVCGGTWKGIKRQPYSEGSPDGNHTRAANLRAFVEPYFGSMRANEITQGHLNAFRDEMRLLAGKRPGTKASDQTVRNKLFALMALLRWAQEEEIIAPIERLLMVKVKATKAVRRMDDPEVLPVSDEDVEALIAASWDPRYTIAILLAAKAGLRIGEIIGAQHGDIKDGAITIRRQVSARGRLIPYPKGKFQRTVPLSPDAIRALSKVAKRGLWIVTHLDDDPRSRGVARYRGTAPGEHMSYSGLNKAIKSVYRKAGVSFGAIDDEHTINVWHSLRHTYGSRLVAEGVSGDEIQLLMGHADYRTTQRYVQVTRKQLAATIKRVYG